jgi:hypothetical protein
MPVAAAIDRVDQWVASGGISSRVMTTTRSADHASTTQDDLARNDEFGIVQLSGTSLVVLSSTVAW